MNNNGWASIEELKERLTRLGNETKIDKSGIPMMYDDDSLYVNTGDAHTIVIGGTGSGKIQATLLPPARLAILAGESIVVNDVKGEIYEVLKNDLDKNGYNTIIINLASPENGNKYNPLSMSYKLYKKGEKDKALEVLESTARYLFSEPKYVNSDPFWENTTVNYFIGLALYLFETKENETTINDIFELATAFNKEMLEKIDKSSAIYANLSGTILAPEETRGSIISVFIQKIKAITGREKLSKMLSTTDFDLDNISNNKTALFIISGIAPYSSTLIPMVITQIYYSVDLYGKKEKMLNVYIDEFEKLNPINRFEVLADYSRNKKIRYTIYIKSLLELTNKYGKEQSELLKMSLGNIIYLLANDIETLEEISNLCGRIRTENGYDKLITPEELKLLNYFEAIILIPRMKPIKTKLLPDYQINWNR